MTDELEIIEEALMNSIPAAKTVLHDGWILRLNQNYTYRANCVCPLHYVPSNNTLDKIKACEELFIDNMLPPVFKVTPILQEGLADLLVSQAYQNIKTVKVMRCALNKSTTGLDDCKGIICTEAPDNEWLEASARLTGITVPALVSVHCQGLKSIAVKSIFVSASIDGKIIGCGYGTVERGYVGIYDLHVDEKFRHRGIATSICRKIFQFGFQHHAKISYLIVHSKNQNAISLYSHMGFISLYDYNFYCKPNQTYNIIDA